MKKKYTILFLDENLNTIESLRKELVEYGLDFSFKSITNPADWEKMLKHELPNVLITTLLPPHYIANDLLTLFQEKHISIPIIIVTNEKNEEIAIKSKNNHVFDYITTDRLYRLGPSVQKALKYLNSQFLELSLQESKEILLKLMDSTTDGFALYDENFNLLTINDKAIWFFSPTEKNLIGKNIIDISPNVIKSGRYDEYNKVIKTGNPYYTESEIPHKINEKIFLSIKAFKAGKDLGIITTDITESKKNEIALKETEEKYKTLIENAGQPVCVIDENGILAFINQIGADYLKLDKNQLIGKSIYDLIPEEIADFYTKKIRVAISMNQSVSNEYKAVVEGKSFWVESRIQPLQNEKNGIKSALVFLLDINDRKKSEEEKSLLVTAINHSIEIIIITNNELVIEYVNPAFEIILGYCKSEIEGQNITILKSYQMDDDYYNSMWKTVTNGLNWSGHLLLKKLDNSVFECEATITPIKDDTGKILNIVGVLRDVTEKRKLEQQVRQTQKLETIGTLAGGIAHDFNNILVPIIGYSELLAEKITRDDNVYSSLEHIIKAGYRAKDLINQILTFSRRVEQERRPIYLQTILKEVIKLLRASIPASIEIEQKINPNCEAVLADPTQMHQVIMNLSVNAFHAMQTEGGVLEIELIMILLDGTNTQLSLPRGKYIRLSVKDTGVGMEQTVLERIFEPFFTTKQNSEGTGLGLSVVHGIVLSHDGQITVESKPGKGTQFHIYFPSCQNTASEDIKNNEMPKGTESILFVDDEEEIAELNRQILEQLGYKPTVTTNSLEALEIFKNNPDDFDLVFTDFTMPKMNGVKLAQEIYNIKPGIPIILCTGYSENITIEKARDLGIKEFVLKPLTISSIAQIIRQALDTDY